MFRDSILAAAALAFLLVAAPGCSKHKDPEIKGTKKYDLKPVKPIGGPGAADKKGASD